MIEYALATSATICFAGIAIYLSPHGFRYLRLPTIRRQIAKERAIVLTYDDGPGEQFTVELLSLLASRNAKATFFLVGSRAEACPGIVDRLIAEGHEIANHTYHHKNAWKILPWQALKDMREGYRTLCRWVAPNVPFRPPYGKLSFPVWVALRRRGILISWWTEDSGDTWPTMPDPVAIVKRIASRGGGVVLLHDFDRTKVREQFVLTVTKLLLDLADREGMRVKRLSDQ